MKNIYLRNFLLNLLFFFLIVLGLSSSHKIFATENNPPILSNPFFDGNGTFSVFYNSTNEKPPIAITVTVRVSLPDGTTHRIERSLEAAGFGPPYSDTYQTATIFLTPGSYSYQFSANDGTNDAIKAEGETALGITEEAPFTLDHTVPVPSSSPENSGGCSFINSDLNNFKISSILFLISFGFLFLRRRNVKN